MGHLTSRETLQCKSNTTAPVVPLEGTVHLTVGIDGKDGTATRIWGEIQNAACSVSIFTKRVLLPAFGRLHGTEAMARHGSTTTSTHKTLLAHGHSMMAICTGTEPKMLRKMACVVYFVAFAHVRVHARA